MRSKLTNALLMYLLKSKQTERMNVMSVVLPLNL